MDKLKPIFIVAMLDTCPHCIRFREDGHLEALKAWVKKNNFEYYEIEAKRGRPMDPSYPPELFKLIPGYPSFLIINPSSWKRRENLVGEVYNFQWNSKGGLELSPTRKDHTAKNIAEWAEKVMIQPNITAKLTTSTVISPSTKKDGILFEFIQLF